MAFEPTPEQIVELAQGNLDNIADDFFEQVFDSVEEGLDAIVQNGLVIEAFRKAKQTRDLEDLIHAFQMYTDCTRDESLAIFEEELEDA